MWHILGMSPHGYGPWCVPATRIPGIIQQCQEKTLLCLNRGQVMETTLRFFPRPVPTGPDPFPLTIYIFHFVKVFFIP